MVRLPPHQSGDLTGSLTPPEMYYQQDADSDNYTCTITDSTGRIAYRLWAPVWFFSDERKAGLAAMASQEFGVRPLAARAAMPLRVMR